MKFKFQFQKPSNHGWEYDIVDDGVIVGECCEEVKQYLENMIILQTHCSTPYVTNS